MFFWSFSEVINNFDFPGLKKMRNIVSPYPTDRPNSGKMTTMFSTIEHGNRTIISEISTVSKL
jgi:hypothetical protein